MFNTELFSCSLTKSGYYEHKTEFCNGKTTSEFETHSTNLATATLCRIQDRVIQKPRIKRWSKVEFLLCNGVFIAFVLWNLRLVAVKTGDTKI